MIYNDPMLWPKKTAVVLITFSISGTSYQAESGMTWYEWCLSDYNTGGFTCSGAVVYLPNSSRAVLLSDSTETAVNGSEKIIEEYNYATGLPADQPVAPGGPDDLIVV